MSNSTPIAKILVLAGLTLVLLAQGYDAVSQAKSGRLSAKLSLAKTEFKEEWDQKMEDAKDSERSQLAKDMRKAREQLEKDDWKELQRDASHAQYDQPINAYWLRWLSLLGSIALVIGLLLVGFYGTGPERMVCLIMLAIITFALFVGGASFRFGR